MSEFYTVRSLKHQVTLRGRKHFIRVNTPVLLNFQNLSKSERRNTVGRSALTALIGLVEIEGRPTLVLDDIECYKLLMRISFVPCPEMATGGYCSITTRVRWTIIVHNGNAYVRAVSQAGQTND